ncbi:unnamed protein product [Cochlearia groenlandica]
MARANNNKYASINYSKILQKDHPSSSASYSSVARSNGRMLVLTKPSPKPLKPLAPAATTTTTPPKTPDPDPNRISLRPLGNTGPPSSLSFPCRSKESNKEVAAPIQIATSPKPDKFVPPHLRPGFVRKDENSPSPGHGPVSSRVIDPNPSQSLAQHEQQPRHGYVRPKSGGCEGIRSDSYKLGRPRSSGNRPGTSGWYC